MRRNRRKKKPLGGWVRACCPDLSGALVQKSISWILHSKNTMILAWLSSCDILYLAVASAAKRKVQLQEGLSWHRWCCWHCCSQTLLKKVHHWVSSLLQTFISCYHYRVPMSAALLSHLQLKWFVLRQASKREQEKQLEREKSLASTLNRKSQKHEDHEGFAPPVC